MLNNDVMSLVTTFYILSFHGNSRLIWKNKGHQIDRLESFLKNLSWVKMATCQLGRGPGLGSKPLCAQGFTTKSWMKNVEVSFHLLSKFHLRSQTGLSSLRVSCKRALTY